MKYFKITDQSKIRGGSNFELDGIYANYDEWEKHQFLPCENMVGVLLAEGQIFEGAVYILGLARGIYVPILCSGVREVIPKSGFVEISRINLSEGHASSDEIRKRKEQEIHNAFLNQWFGGE